ncbi:uncharacterized protein LOC131673738 [Phymastichus coffea]|uniref:uncharacterized protein LOC131673738 n=1 Tax=Phymastichus coffea TaxID=108790 RepID=UPI00273BE1B4|nr:uncharacterized protein LOC131673738 [Phymastichus coffea]
MKMKVEELLKIVVIIGSLAMLTRQCSCQDIIFPGDDEAYSHVSGSAPVTQRKPLKVNDGCPENMFLWPDDGPRSAWVCDCKPRFVYFPKIDACHEVFQRGPCLPQHYVYLTPNQTIPSCVPNPCKQVGYVAYRGICHPLRAKGGPCKADEVLHVNETTYQLECLGADLVPFVIIDAPHRRDGNCPKGSRRSSLGVCKIVL